MAKKTTWKVITVYDGTADVKEVFTDMIAARIRRNEKLTMEKKDGKVYNLGASCDNNDLPGLAG